jgi:hypothetical protein
MYSGLFLLDGNVQLSSIPIGYKNHLKIVNDYTPILGDTMKFVLGDTIINTRVKSHSLRYPPSQRGLVLHLAYNLFILSYLIEEQLSINIPSVPFFNPLQFRK